MPDQNSKNTPLEQASTGPDTAAPSDSMVFWRPGHVTRSVRERLAGQKALIIWLTGLSASGKSTTTYELKQQLASKQRLCYVLDGDNLRHGINRNLGFSHADRTENIRRTAEIAHLMNEAGLDN